ncbi:hypothetical protein AgCh_034415 [Apium graveolens]
MENQSGSLNNVNHNVANLKEPLLDHGYNKDTARGCDTVTPYQNAGLFRTLFFSWLTPLLALAVEKKTLELDDIPQLGPFNSVFGAFPLFRTTLLNSSSQVNHNANVGGFNSNVTTELGLAKASSQLQANQGSGGSGGELINAVAVDVEAIKGPIFLLPDTLSLLVQAKVSLGRIASFLSLEELQDNGLEKLPVGSSDTAVEIINGNFTWDNKSFSNTATLKDLNFKVSHGMKVGICGTVGSGKSSLLSCILGEMPRISGEVKLCGTKAYVAQTPWIRSGTVQENILFGKDMDRQRYDQVLEACCLKKDLEILSFGDQTLIGEKGINLSGGQKQRIQIARALYHDVDIYLFDDPFSAVDAHTSSHLFKEVLLGFLSGKTVIYVTHQVEFLNAADVVVVMKSGRTVQVGKYDDILVPGSEFIQLVGAQNASVSSTLDSNRTAPDSADHTNTFISKENVNGKLDEEGGAVSLAPAAQLIKEEERGSGRVGFSVHWRYITTAYG